MSKKHSHSPHGEGASRFEGREQHGWSPDVDETAQQSNPSAHRSFRPDRYAPEPDAKSKASDADRKKSMEGTPVESHSRRGEEHARKSRGEGTHDTGPKGRSRRPSGTRDASAVTGVDPQEPKNRQDPNGPQDPPSKRSG